MSCTQIFFLFAKSDCIFSLHGDVGHVHRLQLLNYVSISISGVEAVGDGGGYPTTILQNFGPGPKGTNGHDLAIYLRQRDLSSDKLPPFEFSCQHTIDSRYSR